MSPISLSRDAVVLAYLAIGSVLLLTYVRSTGAPLGHYLLRRWRIGRGGWGTAQDECSGSAWLAPTVRSPPRLGSLLAQGGLRQRGRSTAERDAGLDGRFWAGQEVGDRTLRLGGAVMALGASLVVTAAYHLGYHEFRGPTMFQPLIGNTLLTLAFLLTGSPAAAIVGHVSMHAAAVLHGMESTVQLPPHY